MSSAARLAWYASSLNKLGVIMELTVGLLLRCLSPRKFYMTWRTGKVPGVPLFSHQISPFYCPLSSKNPYNY